MKLASGLGKIIFNPVLLLVVLIVVAAGAASIYKRYQDTQKQVEILKNPQEAARLETKQTVESVGKLISLPDDETPTIATVTNKDRLKEQTFFAKTENGDKVLIYPQARKAILYRPSTNKIIEVGQVNIGEQTQTQQKK